ncbi:hypothetical protein CI109_105273 [Kwoniella shandongensis]|uniref:Uncharacterized protein n=1 Tax=Kwoniella shandongensis TaxID=1734106 RepID=A0A5M6C4L2_9TREE|nr:uncharacterized protein CI109_002116 [Kwoniella shandongensis]KAA5529690.1 hypothetical protein CI109_002116 [Kwoniella shandongensis]
MGHSTIPPHLLSLLASPQIGTDYATDVLEEWIAHRRTKGDTLFDVSVGLAELEDRTPPHLAYAFDRARYMTNVPQPSDLTPPMGPFPLARSASPVTILHHLLSQPPPSIEHSREVILEYVLAREGKLKEKKPGRGGKGTLGREGFDDIGKRLGEIEEGLTGGSTTSPKQPISSMPMASSSSRDAYPTPRSSRTQSLTENQQIGLTLILSLRMSLSYFSLQELANQLLSLALGDAERTLVQHVRRRVQGEGRWGVGKELEYVESLTLPQRPALRPAFRSAKTRTLLPARPVYPIQLPAPSKSACIKLIQTLAKEVDAGGPIAATGYIQSHTPGGLASPAANTNSPAAERSHFLSRKGTAASPTTNATLGSPQTPLSSLPPPLSSPGGPSRSPLPDTNILANYTLELVSEFLTREKREHMAKSKWAKSGRDQLSKDLGDIEAGLCLVSKNTASPHAQTLLPIFLLLRRTFALPRSPLPPAITEPYLDILPAPPDPDDVPFREPTVGTTTAALYVNPRLDDAAAQVVLEELIDSEKEKVDSAGGSREEMIEWVTDLIDSVQKRFPDGSYEDVFNTMKQQVATTPASSPQMPQSVSFSKQPSVHRRAKSTAVSGPETGSPLSLSIPSNAPARQQHLRSLSMPSRRSTYDESDSDTSSDEVIMTKPVVYSTAKQLPPLQMFSPTEYDGSNTFSAASATGSGGWWDVVSAIETDNPAPWNENRLPSPPALRTTSNTGSHNSLPLPPGAEPAQVLDFSAPMLIGFSKLDMNSSSPPRPSGGQRITPVNSPGNRAMTLDVMGTSPPSNRTSPSQRRDGIRSAGVEKAFNGYLPQERLPPPPLRYERQPNVGQSPGSQQAALGQGTPPQASPVPITPVSATTPASAPTRSKLGGFGRSMSFAMQKKDKENEKSGRGGNSPADAGKKEKEKGKVQNAPGKWNRDMVANIMGPPAERR